jgi:SAM-dependent methyltransferase
MIMSTVTTAPRDIAATPPATPPIVLNVTPRLVELATVMADSYVVSVKAAPRAYYMEYYLNYAPHLGVLHSVGRPLGIRPEHTVVEVGSGMGTRCLLGNALFKAHFIGIEPHPGTYSPLRAAMQELRDSNPAYTYELAETRGEATGLPSACADIVWSFEVLEHVQDPESVVREMYRILKPGGKMFIATCNYASFYEGHYRHLWLPFLTRATARPWVKAFGRNPHFLDEVNFITRRELVGYARESGFADIKVGWRYSWDPIPPLVVHYPEGFDPHYADPGKPFLSTFIQRRPVHKLLAMAGMEYKVYVEATKA